MGRPPRCDKNGIKKGPWTAEEDQLLIDYIQKHGYGNWRKLPINAGLQRCGKSCRLRWTNYLRPDIKRGRFSFEEEEAIIQLHSILGNKWSAMASRLPGRTDNEIKNYWNTHIRKRLLRMGIDPVTHCPRLDHLDLSSLYMNHNSHLLKLAVSLISSSQNQSFSLGENYQNQLCDDPQYQQVIETNYQIPVEQKNVENFQSNFTNGEWPRNNIIGTLDYNSSTLIEDDVANYMPCYSDYYYQPVLDFPSDINNDVNNQNNSFATSSALSTPASSTGTAPLNSNSYIHHGHIEDGKESYCSSNIFKFEIPDILDVSELLM
ncbi:hypothetical protein ACFE04_000468 [Oxalis oulophora]